MKNVLTRTDFNFPGQIGVYKGKVRDVYNIADKFLLMVVTDRISAFDVVLPKGIPYKGQVLNQIASKFLNATNDIVPNWKISTPDPMVMFGHKCEPYPVEMIIRGFLVGSSWKDYKRGSRTKSGIVLPDGMRENQQFEYPIITPTTKAKKGKHDEDISREEIIKSGLVSEDEYFLLEKYTTELFLRGSQIAEDHGLIFVDTKYEFGKKDGKIYLLDEVNTPDSSRYFYLDGYQENFKKGLPQRQLSKEFVREWLKKNGFEGKEGQKISEMSDQFICEISDRYIELYENIIGEKFVKPGGFGFLAKRIEENVFDYIGANFQLLE